MKKIISLTLILIITGSALSQQTNPSPTLTNQDYLKKSKGQKTGAFILLGAGLLSASLGSVQVNPNIGGNNSGNTAFLVTGLTAIGISVPLFLASSKNKKKAMSMSFKNQMMPQLQSSGFVYKTVPSLNFKISL